MATPKKTPKPAKAPSPEPKRGRGRPPAANPLPNVTGLRLPPALTADLDAWAAEENGRGPGRVTRSSLITHILQTAVDARRAARAGS